MRHVLQRWSYFAETETVSVEKVSLSQVKILLHINTQHLKNFK
jgi:hypothetical protein